MSEFRRQQAQRILSCYGVDKLIKAEPLDVQWRQVKKKDGTTFMQRKHVRVSSPIKDFSKIKEEKKSLSSEHYPIEKVDRFVQSIMDDKFLKKVKDLLPNPGKYILLPMPSSTGKNIIPAVMSVYLKRKLGMSIADPTSVLQDEIYESKKTRGIDKLLKQTQYYFEGLETQGKEIVIVDDINTTGLGIENMRKALKIAGYNVSDVNISLASTGDSKISESGLNLIYERLKPRFPDVDENLLKQRVEGLRGYNSKIGKDIILDLHHSKKKLREGYYSWIKNGLK